MYIDSIYNVIDVFIVFGYIPDNYHQAELLFSIYGIFFKMHPKNHIETSRF